MLNFFKTGVLIFMFLTVSAYGAPAPEYWAFWDASDEANSQVIDHAKWDGVLGRYAVLDEDSGIVSFSYGSLNKADVTAIKTYIAAMEKIDPRRYAGLVQKAYWMNLYNALSVLAVHENYKMLSQSNFQQGLPEEAWAKKRVKIVKTKLSLNDIEHRILRPIFRDHKILFGLNCTTLDCPNFSKRAYTAKTIKSQLKAAGVRFINNNKGLRYRDGVLHASSLFKDYFSDFAKNDKMLMKVFAHYAEDMKALYVLGHTGAINYTRDSRLNIR